MCTAVVILYGIKIIVSFLLGVKMSAQNPPSKEVSLQTTADNKNKKNSRGVGE